MLFFKATFIIISTLSIYSLTYPMEQIYDKAQLLAKIIQENSKLITQILSTYQTYQVTEYEIERSIRTLNGLHHNKDHLNSGKTIDSAAITLPSNLPLYSLIIFGIIPSFLIKQVNIRPNALLQKDALITHLAKALDLNILFPQINITNTDHAGFKNYINTADLVVFTGNPDNATKLNKEMKKNSLLIVNGSGHNPVVVTESADINKAIEGTLLLKSFNGGQDCAGPDAILVHSAIAKEFIQKFTTQFSTLKTGPFGDPTTIIGPINRLDELKKFLEIFWNNQNDIICGGTIDGKNSSVAPTVIVRDIKNNPNYQEMFGPVAFIHPYESDEDLHYYFNDKNGKYNAHRMYVTVYGHSVYMLNKDDQKNPNQPGNVGIILQDQTIHDVEIGYKEYGGFSFNASHVVKKTEHNKVQKCAMPILIPEIINEYLIKNKDLPKKITSK